MTSFLLCLAMSVSGSSGKMPTDPLQRMAYKAVVLRQFEPMPEWKRNVYQYVLDHDLRAGLARRTTYCYSCAGRRCADGTKVGRGKCAASRNIKMGSLIWLETDGLLRVHDRGGGVRPNRKKGETAAFDVWFPSCKGGGGTKSRVAYAVIPKEAKR